MPRKPTPIAMAEPAPDYRSFSHPPRAERPQAQRAPRQVGRLPDPIPTSPILPVDRVGREPVTLPYMRQPKEIPTVTPIYQDPFGQQPKPLLCDPTPLYPGSWSSCDPGGGGNFHSLLVHPRCEDTLFVGPDNGTMARGVRDAHGRVVFENFMKGIPGSDTVAIAMSPLGVNDQLYSICGGMTPPDKTKGLMRMFRFDPAALDWKPVPYIKWKWVPSSAGSTTQYPGTFGSTPPLLHVSRMPGGKHLVIATSGAKTWPITFDVLRDANGSYVAAGGTIATPAVVAKPEPVTYSAPILFVGIPGASAADMSWFGRPYRFTKEGDEGAMSAADASAPVWVHPTGFGSLWVPPPLDGSTLSAYLTIAYEFPGAPTTVRFTELVKATIVLDPSVSSVESISFQTLARNFDPVVSAASADGAWYGPGPIDLGPSFLDGADPAAQVPVEMVQVAGVPDKTGGANLWVTIYNKLGTSAADNSSPFAPFPRVVWLNAPKQGPASVSWKDEQGNPDKRHLSLDSLDATNKDFLATTARPMTFCRATDNGHIYVAPGKFESGESSQLWRWDDDADWHRLTFYFGWAECKTLASFEAHPPGKSALDVSYLQSWFDGFEQVYDGAANSQSAEAAFADPELGAKILMAIGTRAKWPMEHVATRYGTPVPNIGVFVTVLDASGNPVQATIDGESVTLESCSLKSDDEHTLSPGKQNPTWSAISHNATPLGELEPGTRFHWTIVPIPIGTFWRAVTDVTANAAKLKLEVRIRTNTANIRTRHRIRMLPLLLAKGDSQTQWTGTLTPPWDWDQPELLEFEAPATKPPLLSILSANGSTEILCDITASGDAVATVNTDQLATWDFRRTNGFTRFNALAVAGPTSGSSGEDRILCALDGDSTVYASWNGGHSFAPQGSSRAKPGFDQDQIRWRSRGLGTMWVYDFLFSRVRTADGTWIRWFFVNTDDGGLFGGPHGAEEEGSPALYDLNWRIPELRGRPYPDGLGPPTSETSRFGRTYALARRFVPDSHGNLQAQILLSVAGKGDYMGRVLLGRVQGGELTWDDRTLVGLPEGPVLQMVSTVGEGPLPASSKPQGAVYAAVLGAGVYALPPGEYKWKKIGEFETMVEKPSGTPGDQWVKATLDGELLNIYHLALCGENPRVLYASVNVLSASRIDSAGYNKKNEGWVVDSNLLFRSHSAAGLYRLEHPPAGDDAGAPLDVEADEPWNLPPSALTFRHVAGLGAVKGYGLNTANESAATAADLNYPQAWRNITSLAGTRSGRLAVTARSVTPAVGADPPGTFDGGMFLSLAANEPAMLGSLPLMPGFGLLFTHLWAAACAFYDRAGEERLFVALNSYGALEVGTNDRSVTPFTKVVETSTVLDDLGTDQAENRNQYYFTADSPQRLAWPVGVFEVSDWSTLKTLADTHTPPPWMGGCLAIPEPPQGTSVSDVRLIGMNDNLCNVAQQWLRMSVSNADNGTLLVGGRGTGAFWRRLPLAL